MVDKLPTDRAAASMPPEIVREKLVMLETPMRVEEALEQIENVGHDFYIFLDAADGELKCIYKRK